MTMTIAEATATLTAPGQIFEVGDETVRGIPMKVWKNAPPSLRAVLEMSRGHGDQTFLVYEDERMTFEEHFRAVAHLATKLVDDYGVKMGDRVAIAMRNFPEWAIAFWAAAVAGAVVVARSEGGVDEGHERFEDVLGDVPADVTLPDVTLEPEDDATIFYTSGTTGRPKGALGTHRNICGNLMSLGFVAMRSGLQAKGPEGGLAAEGGQQNSSLLSVPFFHATGCHSVLVANTAFGGKLVIMYKWDPERALELIEREEVTNFGGVPSMVWQVLDSPDFAKRDTSSVISVGYGGAPAPPELVRRIRQHFPTGSASNGYRLTETSSVTTMNAGEDYYRKPDSVGPPVPVVEVKVVDEQGNTAATGEIGELWIKGPNIVKGYWNNPDATAATFTDGWLHSGDVARLDEDGFVYIVDRAKDMLIRGGEKMYCVEVEAALYDDRDVADAAGI